MAKIGNRIQETTATAGTGALALGGADPGYRRFLDTPGIVSGDYVHYTLEARNGAWEVGAGVVTAGIPDTLSRAFVFDSSNGGALIDLPAGTHRVICAPTASMPRICRVHMGTTDRTPVSGWNLISWVAEARDDFNGWSSGDAAKLYVPAWASRVRLRQQARILGYTSTRTTAFEIRKSGSGISFNNGSSMHSTNGEHRAGVATGEIDVVGTDYFQSYFYTTSTTDRLKSSDQGGASPFNWLELEIVQ